MSDFLKFLFKKDRKSNCHSNKKKRKKASLFWSRKRFSKKSHEMDEAARRRSERMEEICNEAVRRAIEADREKEALKAAAQKQAEITEICDVRDDPIPSDVPTEVAVEENVVNRAEAKAEDVRGAPIPENGKYIIKLSGSGIYTFVLKSPKGDTIVSSGDYTLKRSCVSGIQSVRKNGITEYIEDQTEEKIDKKPNPKYEVYLGDNDKYRFRLKAPNGYVILDSQAFASKKNCLRTIASVRRYCLTEDVEEIIKQTKNKGNNNEKI